MKEAGSFRTILNLFRNNLLRLESIVHPSEDREGSDFLVGFASDRLIRRHYQLFIGSDVENGQKILRISPKKPRLRVFKTSRTIFKCGINNITEIFLKGELGEIVLLFLAKEGHLPMRFSMKFFIRNATLRDDFLELRTAILK